MSHLTLINHQMQFKKVKKGNKKKSPSKVIPFPAYSAKEKEIKEVNAVFLELKEQHLVVINELVLNELAKHEERPSFGRNNYLGNGHISNIKNLYRKVSAIPMSIYFPTPFILYKDELVDTFSSSLWTKLFASSLLTLALSIGGYTVGELITGLAYLVIIAILDAVLGILPNTVVGKKAKKDHTLQAKWWMFLTNVLGITAMFALHIFLEKMIKDPNLAQKFVINLHYLSISWVGVIYFGRIIKYIATANKTKVPKFISSIFTNKK